MCPLILPTTTLSLPVWFSPWVVVEYSQEESGSQSLSGMPPSQMEEMSHLASETDSRALTGMVFGEILGTWFRFIRGLNWLIQAITPVYSAMYCLKKIKSVFEAVKCLLLWHFNDNINFCRLKTSNLNF